MPLSPGELLQTTVPTTASNSDISSQDVSRQTDRGREWLGTKMFISSNDYETAVSLQSPTFKNYWAKYIYSNLCIWSFPAPYKESTKLSTGSSLFVP